MTWSLGKTSDQTGNRAPEGLPPRPAWQYLAYLVGLCRKTISQVGGSGGFECGHKLLDCTDSDLGLSLIYVGKPLNIVASIFLSIKWR